MFWKTWYDKLTNKNKKITVDNIYDVLDTISEENNDVEIKQTHQKIAFHNKFVAYKSFVYTGGIVLLMLGFVSLQNGGLGHTYQNTIDYFDSFETPQTKKILMEKKLHQEFRKGATDKYKDSDSGEIIYLPVLEDINVHQEKVPKVNFTYNGKKYSLFVNETFADNIYTITEISNTNISIKRIDGFEAVIPVG